MPTIPLNDVLGLSLNGELVPGARLATALPSFVKLAALPIDQVPVADAAASLNLGQPVPIPLPVAGLTLTARGSGSVTLIGPTRPALDEFDPFNEITIAPNEFYLALTLTVSADPDVSGGVGLATFGFSATRAFEIRCYRRFLRGSDGFPPFGKALALVASSVFLPKTADDLKQLQDGTVLVLRGDGALSISAGVEVSLPTDPLAHSVSGPAGIEIAAGGTMDVDASLTLTGAYQVRLRRLDPVKTELGVYTLQSKELDLSISATIGVAATAGPFDLGSRFIKALTRQPAIDSAEFVQALPGEDQHDKAERIDSFQSSIQSAISTKLEASVTAGLTALRSNEAALLYAVDQNLVVADAAKAALAAAFLGKFDALTRDPQNLPPGVTEEMNVFTHTGLRTLTLNVNLMGLVNLMSATTLVQTSSVERDSSGDITLITDTSNASRLQALLINFGNNQKRLRKLLSESFLIEAAYQASELSVLPPTLRAKHTHFSIDDRTSRDEMKDILDVVRALNLTVPGAAQQQLGQRPSFGRTTFYAEARYATDAVRDAFLNPPAPFENLGRTALASLLAGDPGQEFRKRVASDDNLWNAMKRIGNRAQFAPLFGLSASALDPRVEAAGVDYSAITSWAKAMTGAAQALREIGVFLGGAPVAPDDPKLTAARDKLKRRLADVVKNTGEEFGEPLGMLMFYLAAGRNADRSVVLSGDQIPRLEIS